MVNDIDCLCFTGYTVNRVGHAGMINIKKSDVKADECANIADRTILPCLTASRKSFAQLPYKR